MCLGSGSGWLVPGVRWVGPKGNERWRLLLCGATEVGPFGALGVVLFQKNPEKSEDFGGRRVRYETKRSRNGIPTMECHKI